MRAGPDGGTGGQGRLLVTGGASQHQFSPEDHLAGHRGRVAHRPGDGGKGFERLRERDELPRIDPSGRDLGGQTLEIPDVARRLPHRPPVARRRVQLGHRLQTGVDLRALDLLNVHAHLGLGEDGQLVTELVHLGPTLPDDDTGAGGMEGYDDLRGLPVDGAGRRRRHPRRSGESGDGAVARGFTELIDGMIAGARNMISIGVATLAEAPGWLDNLLAKGTSAVLVWLGAVTASAVLLVALVLAVAGVLGPAAAVAGVLSGYFPARRAAALDRARRYRRRARC